MSYGVFYVPVRDQRRLLMLMFLLLRLVALLLKHLQIKCLDLFGHSLTLERGGNPSQ